MKTLFHADEDESIECYQSIHYDDKVTLLANMRHEAKVTMARINNLYRHYLSAIERNVSKLRKFETRECM